MKTWILIALGFSLATAAAEDVKMANGGVLKNVTINWGDDSGVSITPSGFAATATKYPWHWIHPDDRQRVQAIAADIATKQQKAFALEKSAVMAAVEVISVEPKGVLARFSEATPVAPLSPNPNAEPTEFTHGRWEDHPVFVYMADTSKMYDGKKGVQKLYRAGTYKDDGSTLRAFAMTTEEALALTAAK